jgi:hypothetical protein
MRLSTRSREPAAGRSPFYGALKRGDYAALEKPYSDDYMLVRPDGSVLDKREVLRDLRTNGLRFHSIEVRDGAVRIYGPTAVLTGESGRQ